MFSEEVKTGSMARKISLEQTLNEEAADAEYDKE